MTVITVCIIILTGLLYILRYFSNSSKVSIYSQIYITFILLSIITSDKLVMSRENLKNFTYVFCKSGALQISPEYLGNILGPSSLLLAEFLL
jgi:hypothetical protein